MIDNESETRGYYTLGFLYIRMNTYEDLSDLNSLLRKDSKVFSTFLHEYIHFLQNFTTTFGLYSSGHYFNLLKNLVDKVRSSNIKIKLPLELDKNYNGLQQNILNQIYRGDSKAINNIEYLNYGWEDVEIIKNNGEAIMPKKYFVEYKNIDNGAVMRYNFGAICLKEFVAHKIQNKLVSVDHDQFPYTISELIINKEVPNLSDKEDLKILLCDISLMTIHPAQFFFNSIEKLKKTNKIPTNPEKFCKYLYEGLSFSGEIGTFDNYIKLFQKIFDNAIYEHHDLFKSPIFINELRWINHILKEGYKLRIKNPTYILNLINKKGKFTIDFVRIIRRFGTPFYMNNYYTGNYIPPKKLKNPPDSPQLLLIASQVLDAFTKKCCSMQQFCVQSYQNGDPTDYNCLENPFLKAKDEQLCTFGQLCKTWDIHEKIDG